MKTVNKNLWSNGLLCSQYCVKDVLGIYLKTERVGFGAFRSHCAQGRPLAGIAAPAHNP